MKPFFYKAFLGLIVIICSVFSLRAQTTYAFDANACKLKPGPIALKLSIGDKILFPEVANISIILSANGATKTYSVQELIDNSLVNKNIFILKENFKINDTDEIILQNYKIGFKVKGKPCSESYEIIDNSVSQNPVRPQQIADQAKDHTSSSFSGIPIYDALLIKELIATGTTKNAQKDIKQLLNLYFPNVGMDSIFQTEAYKTFLYESFNDILHDTTSKDRGETQSISGVGISSLLSKAGNMNVSTQALGFADFLMERAKEEIGITYITKLKDAFKEFPELRTIFPRTNDFLNLFESYEIPNILNVARETYINDVRNLPQNILNLRDLTDKDCNGSNSKCSDRIKAISDFFADEKSLPVQSLLIAAQSFIDADNPIEVLEKIAQDKNIRSSKTAYASSVKLSYVLSGSITNKDENELWADLKTLKELVNDNEAFRIYCGLTLAKFNTEVISFKNKDGINIGLTQILESLNHNHEILLNIFESGKQLTETIRRIKKTSEEGKSVGFNEYAQVSQYTLGILNNTSELIKPYFDDHSTFYDISKNIQNISELVAAVQINNYNQVIITSSILLSDNIKTIQENHALEKIVHSGIFFASLIDAKTPEDVKKVIQANALPAGSSAMKSYSAFSVFINSYIGGFWAKGNSNKYIGAWAPTGISLNFGTNWKPIGVITVFGSVFDVGSFVSYRLTTNNNDTTNQTPQMKLENLISPGGHLILGRIYNSPFSLSIGAQYGPRVWSFKNDEIKNQDLWRFNIGLSFDIPLLKIYVKPIK